MNVPAGHSVRREIASAYLASAARIIAWAGVSAILFRSNETIFAAFALVRATSGLLNYTSIGLAPAMISHLAHARSESDSHATGAHGADSKVLSYARPREDPIAVTYSNGLVVGLIVAAVGLSAVILYAAAAYRVHDLPLFSLRIMVLFIGAGTLLRVVSDVPGAALQALGNIRTDNWLIAAAEASWLLVTALLWWPDGSALEAAIVGYVTSGALLIAWRAFFAWRVTSVFSPRWSTIRSTVIRGLLGSGALIAAAQFADFLYAPVNFVLIGRLLTPDDLAAYAPAVQIDAALLLIAGGIASVMLPRTALAHAAGETATVRRYYVKGTLITALALLAGALATWLLAPLLLPLWLGEHEALSVTLSILPFVLTHTVIGGSSAVGRSVLLGIGRARAFTIAALSAGVANVVLAYLLVRCTDLGLRGIIYATILVVCVRAIVWMPAYVLWSLRHPVPRERVPETPPAPIA